MGRYLLFRLPNGPPNIASIPPSLPSALAAFTYIYTSRERTEPSWLYIPTPTHLDHLQLVAGHTEPCLQHCPQSLRGLRSPQMGVVEPFVTYWGREEREKGGGRREEGGGEDVRYRKGLK